jgi:CheY-like chemotaxis protein
LPSVPLSAANAYALVVLLVEDEFFVRDDIATYLREAGFAVVECVSGETAIEHCMTAAVIDILITDINLGGPASGWDVAEYFQEKRPDVPVVFTSGQAIDHERCIPGSVFFGKPYRNRDILNACHQLRPG